MRKAKQEANAKRAREKDIKKARRGLKKAGLSRESREQECGTGEEESGAGQKGCDAGEQECGAVEALFLLNSA